MTDLVPKGAMARDRMERDPDVAVACDDLARLADFGALAGVAEILRERVRQVEALGFTPEHDAQVHPEGWLYFEAIKRAAGVARAIAEGTAGYPECEEGFRQAGALLAAEADRLNRMLAGPGKDNPASLPESRHEVESGYGKHRDYPDLVLREKARPGRGT